ncbi:hypothetical protein AAVH_09990 [Aphelenchoides avenae]|nr:hypothetical protein AAVH_09990 [Aphelenchus avenae]
MPTCSYTCPAAVWIGLYREAGDPLTPFKWSDGTAFGATDYRNCGIYPYRPYRESFATRTYVSIYGDPMDTTQLWGQAFYGKWDHFRPNSPDRMRAGVCKRDY